MLAATPTHRSDSCNTPTTLGGLFNDVSIPLSMRDCEVSGIALDSRQVRDRYVFFALPGGNAHGLDYLDSATDMGVLAVAVDSGDGQLKPSVKKQLDQAQVTLIVVDNLQQQLGHIAARFYHYPSERMHLVGVTGTDGKTTVSQLLAQAMHSDKTPAATIGTIGAGVYGQLDDSPLTTPDAISLQAILHRFVQQSVPYVSMEVSSHAIVQGRVQGVAFDTLVLTNLGRDHIDYHGSIEAYHDAKWQLVSTASSSTLVLNLDDPAIRRRLGGLDSGRLITYTTQDEYAGQAHIVGKDIRLSTRGIEMTIVVGGETLAVQSRLLGRFNAGNLLAVFACLRSQGMDVRDIAGRLARIRAVPGRAECFSAQERAHVVVDYSHTPQALEAILSSVRQHCDGRLWCVFGCGGDRDKGKRPLMAKVAESLADRVIVTDDNPRHEDGDEIAADIMRGFKVLGRVWFERNRRVAIALAIAAAARDDWVVVAGKGHEDYQIIGDRRHDFSDREVVKGVLESPIGVAASPFALSLRECAVAINAQHGNALLKGGDTRFSRVSTDTRTLESGDVFVALMGENYDAHDKIDARVIAKASALVVQKIIDTGGRKIPQLLVQDTCVALGCIASRWRSKFNIPVVAITGSNGKTTVKEMVAKILSQGSAVFATQGNLNNDIGLPLSILSTQSQHQYAVYELGANHLGEIAYLTQIAAPDVALINNAGAAHLEGFGSLDGVAEGKGEIYSGLGQHGIAIVNADDAYAAQWLALNRGRRTMTFAMRADADVCAAFDRGELTLSYRQNTVSLRLPLSGQHNAMNALSAAAVCLALGLSLEEIARGLVAVRAASGRLEFKRTLHGSELIDDSYNANPSSLKAGLAVLCDKPPGATWCVLGDMNELGDQAVQIHRQMGADAKSLKVDRFFVVGQYASHMAQGFGTDAQVFDSVDSLIEALSNALTASDRVLIKGSRGAKMERVVDALVGSSEPHNN